MKIIIALFLVFYSTIVFAEIIDIGGFSINNTSNGPTPNIKNILDNITNIMLGILISVAVIMAIYSGYLYLGAAGNTTKLKEASQALIWAGVAAGVGLLSKGIINLVLAVLGSTTKI